MFCRFVVSAKKVYRIRKYSMLREVELSNIDSADSGRTIGNTEFQLEGAVS